MLDAAPDESDVLFDEVLLFDPVVVEFALTMSLVAVSWYMSFIGMLMHSPIDSSCADGNHISYTTASRRECLLTLNGGLCVSAASRV